MSSRYCTVRNLVLSGFLFILGSCHGREGQSANPPVKDSTGYRIALVEALERLHTVIASNDKNLIAGLFSFPIPDSMLSIFINDSVFERRKKAVGREWPRELYDTWYDSISNAWQMQEFRKVFVSVDVKKLEHTNRVKYEAVLPSEPCYRYYSITIGEDSIISINYGTDTNKKFKGKASPKEEGMGDECEYATIWQFRFDGERLRLIRQTAAG